MAEGIVKWFSEQKGYGFIQHEAGRDIFVHYSSINMEGFKEMIPFDWSGYPALNAYIERMRADPHWAGTAPESLEALGRMPATSV